MLASILYDYGRFSVEVKSTLLLGAYVDTASSMKELYIDDGAILFCFIEKDDTEHGIDFLTSEYYYEGGNYYTVREREKLRELMDRVRDYYQMEVRDGE